MPTIQLFMERLRVVVGAGSQASMRETLGKCAAVQALDPLLKRLAKITSREPISPMLLDRLVSPDALVRTNALKIINFSHDEPSTSLANAVDKHGYDRVRSAIVTSAAHHVHVTLAAPWGVSATALTLQVVATAVIAESLAKDLDYPLLSVSALLANVGVAALAAIHGAAYADTWAGLAGTAIPVHEGEKYSFRVDHAEVASILLAELGFDGLLVEAVLAHTCAPGKDRSMGSLLSLGQALAHQMGFDGGVLNVPLEIPSEIVVKFGLTDERLGKITERTLLQTSCVQAVFPSPTRHSAKAA